MGRSDFLKSLHSSAKSLRRLFSRRGHEWLSRIIVQGQDEKGKDLSVERIYELLCCFSLLNELADKLKLICVEGKGHKGYRFPYSPGDKQNFAFFRFEHNNQTYDICCGTGIPNKYNTGEEHPDISLQIMRKESLSSEPGKPVGIWDAKHHKVDLTKDDVYQLSSWIDLLNMDHFLEQDILRQLMPKSYQAYAVITNTNANKLSDMYKSWLLDRGFSIVHEYQGNNSSIEPAPSINEHMHHKNIRKGGK